LLFTGLGSIFQLDSGGPMVTIGGIPVTTGILVITGPVTIGLTVITASKGD
jgi:hypothetical protein